MPIKKPEKRAVRRLERQDRHRNRVPQQPDGQNRGKHLGGFKGMKIDAECFCGGCNARTSD